MKKLLLFLAIAVSSCSTENSNNTNDNVPELNCTCETIIRADVFSLPSGYVWTVATLENDCTGAQRQRDLVGRHLLGENICN
jgi:hypothetical protein